MRAAAQARLAKAAIEPSGSAEAPRSPAPRPWPAVPSSSTVIAIGASTGGTEAIREVLAEMPETSPAIVVVQHIPPVFSTAFANRLNDLCRIRGEGSGGWRPCPARPGADRAGQFSHDAAKNAAASIASRCTTARACATSGRRWMCCSNSVAQAAGANAIGALLTGMGADGARGTAQNEAGRRADHGAGRSQLRGFRHAARSDPAASRRSGAAARPHCARADRAFGRSAGSLIQACAPIADKGNRSRAASKGEE